MAEPSPLDHLLAVHSALRVRARALARPSVSDHDLRSESEQLADALCAHCQAEEAALVPVLRRRLEDIIAAGGEEKYAARPLKRARGMEDGGVGDVDASEVLRCLSECSDEHRVMREKAEGLREAGIGVREDVAGAAAAFGEAVVEHLDVEEAVMFPVSKKCLSDGEQRRVVVEAGLGLVQNPVGKNLLAYLSPAEIACFVAPVLLYGGREEVRFMLEAGGDVWGRERWAEVCAELKKGDGVGGAEGRLVENPLVEIVYLHRSIRAELEDLVEYCADLDVCDDMQLACVAKRLQFLKRVHACHSDGEDSVLVEELRLRMRAKSGAGAISSLKPSPAQSFVSDSDVGGASSASGPSQKSGSVFHEDHSDEVRLFDVVGKDLDLLRRQMSSTATTFDKRTPEARKADLVTSIRGVATHLITHMEQEEEILLPLLREHFTVEDQSSMMRRVMGRIPAAFLPDLIPWVVSLLNVDDRERLIRNVLRTASPDEFARTCVVPLSAAVGEGVYDRNEWNELCLRIPELRVEPACLEDEVDDSPVAEVMRVHKAIRVELRGLLRAASALSDDQVPNPKRLASLAERAAFLGRMVGEHSKAEDIVLLPRLEERCPGVSTRYSSEHCEERALFVQMNAILEELQCASDDIVCGSLVRKLRVVTRTLRDEMVDHLRMEEEHLWPILTKNFTKEEQAEIVGLVFGLMPADRFRELLPWMIRVLSTSEQATMMTHILQVTKSTMFESWLNSWFTPPETKEWDAKVGGSRTKTGSEGKGGRDEGGSSASVQQPSASASSSLSTVAHDSVDETASAAAALVLLHRKDDVKLAIREIAADSSLPAEVRTRMMQRVMLAPWSQRAAANSRTSAEDSVFTPSYRDAEKRIFGCTHYARNCKLVANCCGKVYTCRLCHDGAESHTMDRTATKLMVCMNCETRQDVAERCGNAACGKLMARYFCDVCVFFQNDPSRSTYHCPRLALLTVYVPSLDLTGEHCSSGF